MQHGLSVVLLNQWTDIIPRKLSRLHGINARDNGRQMMPDCRPVVGRQFEYGDFAIGQILLIAEVLVGGHKEIELLLRELEQIPILETSPPAALRAGAGMDTKMFGQRPRNALVEDKSHAASRAASERSNTRQAKSLVTEGKHSINSSRV